MPLTRYYLSWRAENQNFYHFRLSFRGLSIDNRHEIALLTVRGTVHYNVYGLRFRFRLKKKPRQLTDLSVNPKRP
jgi:hypothetical protein